MSIDLAKLNRLIDLKIERAILQYERETRIVDRLPTPRMAKKIASLSDEIGMLECHLSEGR